MRKSRFTDERVVGIIRAAFAGQIARTAPRCITAPPGATAARSRPLKLIVVRRNRAGHRDMGLGRGFKASDRGGGDEEGAGGFVAMWRSPLAEPGQSAADHPSPIHPRLATQTRKPRPDHCPLLVYR